MFTLRRSIGFAVEGLSPASDYARLRCTVTWRGQRIRSDLGCLVTQRYWDKTLQRVKARTWHGPYKIPSNSVNNIIDAVEQSLEALFAAYDLKKRVPKADEVRAVIAKNAGKAIVPSKRARNAEQPSEASKHAAPDKQIPSLKPPTLTDGHIIPLFEEYIAQCAVTGSWSDHSIKKNNTILAHLRQMDPDLTFDSFAQEGLAGFVSYLSSVTDKKGQRGLANATIAKDVAFVKSFLIWARDKGYCDNIDDICSQKVRLRSVPKPVIFLEWDELMRLYDFDFGKRHTLAAVRDVFCFSCFTSLRFSDIRNLRRANISDRAIHLTTIKTAAALTIELNKYSRAILDKYAHLPLPNDAPLPVISNQKSNIHLHEIGRLCGFDTPIPVTTFKGNKRYDSTVPKYELLTMHAGRRTFVSNALMMGIPPEVVMRWTGHSSYSAMKPYIAIADTTKQQAMTAFDNK